MQIWSKFLNFNLENRSELVTMDGLEYLGDYSIETWPGSLQLSCFLANRHLQIMYVIKPVLAALHCKGSAAFIISLGCSFLLLSFLEHLAYYIPCFACI